MHGSDLQGTLLAEPELFVQYSHYKNGSYHNNQVPLMVAKNGPLLVRLCEEREERSGLSEESAGELRSQLASCARRAVGAGHNEVAAAGVKDHRELLRRRSQPDRPPKKSRWRGVWR